MVRDWDLIRAILLKLEAAESARTSVAMGQVDGFDAQEAAYHMLLLKEAGLIEANIMNSGSSNDIGMAIARRLTWSGHEFLDIVRDPTVWGKIKSKVKEKGFDLTFDAIKAAAALLFKGLAGS